MIFSSFRDRTPRQSVFTTQRAARTVMVLGVFLCVFSGTALAAAVAPQTLRYQVEYQGQNAGELEVIIDRDGADYLVTSISHLSLLAQMFLDNTRITSRFEKAGDGYRLAGGEEIATESNSVRRSFEVDYQRNQINFLEGEPLAFDPTVKMDADGFPLVLVMDDRESLTGTQLLSVSPKRGRLYVHDESRNETVTVPAGEFASRLVIARRADDSDRAIKYWLRSEDRMPVRIVTGKPGKETILSLLP